MRSFVTRGRMLLPLLLLFVMGCGAGRYPVTGRVTYEDGSPVEDGTVIAEATVDGKAVGVQGAIAKDGTFSWGGDRPGDGALPGTYKVLVMPPTIPNGPAGEGKVPAVDGKFTKYDTSGLSFEVKPERNEFNIKVPRPKPKKDKEEP